MRLLLDMNLSPEWCDVLQQAGFDTVHWSAVGRPSASDREILTWAGRESRVLVTNDLDFGAILAASDAGGPSVVQVRAQDVTPRALSATLIRLLRQHGDALNVGALISLDEASARVRILPFTGR